MIYYSWFSINFSKFDNPAVKYVKYFLKLWIVIINRIENFIGCYLYFTGEIILNGLKSFLYFGLEDNFIWNLLPAFKFIQYSIIIIVLRHMAE